MIKINSYFLKSSNLSIFALFVILISFGEVLHQNAYAQENLADFLYEPAIDALTAFATGVAESAPKIIAAVILLIIGLIAGKIIGGVVKKASIKILQKVHKDENKNNDDVVSQTTSSEDSSKLISSSVRWFVYLFFIIAAINALEFEQLSLALTDLWLWVPNLLAFILIIVIGLIIVNFIGKWISQELIKKEYGGSKYVITGVKVVLYAVIFAIAITQLGIGTEIIPILVAAFSWSIAAGVGAAIAIGLGFALKDVIPGAINIASKQRSMLKVGQKVQVGEEIGTVTAVEMLHVIIANERNESVIIPTKELSDKPIRIFGDYSNTQENT